jgi:RNA polymerase sigma-70 factor (ECF subfamily)
MGQKTEQADDAVQGFFENLLAYHTIPAADPARGRFRTFLLTCFQNYLHNRHKSASRAKRDGTVPFISLDDIKEHAVELPDPTGSAPEQLYELHWARTVLERALSIVREDYQGSGRGPLFEALRPVIWGGQIIPLSEIASTLGISLGAVKVVVHRLRERFRDVLRGEVAQTVSHPEEVEVELRHLIAVLSRQDSL